ncbi:hypothetical protein MIMGU_mgv1a017646mg [Erythranthe guttata]|uniref:J domain-containing protein n=1 Tax=Erythranthe guttata TaxID=4155 RepID=A0A022QT06_ERYGU|nr:hypothetical protein MIMGU_mgv1a017646mg [Erythranthe guttata]
MEVSMQIMMNDTVSTRVPLMHKHKPFSKNKKLTTTTISCQVAMQTHDKNTADFYRILSLKTRNVGFDEIKKAYKTMALQYHPDVCTSNTNNNTDFLTKEESTKRFIELRKAYETLSDPYSRKIYDSELGSGDGLFGVHFPREVWERQLNGLRKSYIKINV